MHNITSSEDYRDRTEDYHRIAALFRRYDREFAPVRVLAREVAEETEAVSPLIQSHTAVVCPSCTQVCCATRHSFHEIADIVYLCSLGESVPPYEEGRQQADPCQFIGPEGCRLKRSLRPYRCNWYFCSPLLEQMQSTAARDYRRFMERLAEIGRKRERLLTLFITVAGGYDACADVPHGQWISS